MNLPVLIELIERHNIDSNDPGEVKAAWSVLKKEYDKKCPKNGLTERKLKAEWAKYKEDNNDRMKKFGSPSRETRSKASSRNDGASTVQRKTSVGRRLQTLYSSTKNRTSDRPTVDEEKSALMNSEVPLMSKLPARKSASSKSPGRRVARVVPQSPHSGEDQHNRSRTKSALKAAPKRDITPAPKLEKISSQVAESSPVPQNILPSKREETPPPKLKRMQSVKKTPAKGRQSEVETSFSEETEEMFASPHRNPVRSCRVDSRTSFNQYTINNSTPTMWNDTSSELTPAQSGIEKALLARSSTSSRSANSTPLKRGAGRKASPKKSPSKTARSADSTPRKRAGRGQPRARSPDASPTQRIDFDESIPTSPFKINRVIVELKEISFSDLPKLPSILNSGDLEEDEILEGRVSASPNPEHRNRSRLCRKRSALDDAKLRLHTSEIPEKLIKREAEYKQIYDFVMNGVTRRESQALYISGVPGTGKTATVMKVIEHVKKTKKAEFQFVAVNALELSNPKRLFCVIYKEFTKNAKSISPANAQQRLNDMFSTIDKKRLPLVLLVDEVDMLYTKRQEVVYTVFNWSATEGSKVSVIAISNTLDLPERILAPRVASRLGSKRLCFQPYDFKELIEIIQHRISNCSAISKDAVEYASRKVGALSGDLRKALELLRRAIDIAVGECEEKRGDLSKVQLTFAHVNAAIQESVRSMRMDYCHTMSADEELLFRALVNDLKRSNMEETTFFRLLMEYKDLCNAQGEEPLSGSVVFRILMDMAGSNFLSLSADMGQMNRRIMLNLPLSEAQFCIRQMDERKNNLINNKTAIKTL